jgi:hypothetical protein
MIFDDYRNIKKKILDDEAALLILEREIVYYENLRIKKYQSPVFDGIPVQSSKDSKSIMEQIYEEAYQSINIGFMRSRANTLKELIETEKETLNILEEKIDRYVKKTNDIEYSVFYYSKIKNMKLSEIAKKTCYSLSKIQKISAEINKKMENTG